LIHPTQAALQEAYGVEIDVQRAFPNDDFIFTYKSLAGFSVGEGLDLQRRGYRLYFPMALDDVPYVIY